MVVQAFLRMMIYILPLVFAFDHQTQLLEELQRTVDGGLVHPWRRRLDLVQNVFGCQMPLGPVENI